MKHDSKKSVYRVNESGQPVRLILRGDDWEYEFAGPRHVADALARLAAEEPEAVEIILF